MDVWLFLGKVGQKGTIESNSIRGGITPNLWLPLYILYYMRRI